MQHVFAELERESSTPLIEVSTDDAVKIWEVLWKRRQVDFPHSGIVEFESIRKIDDDSTPERRDPVENIPVRQKFYFDEDGFRSDRASITLQDVEEIAGSVYARRYDTRRYISAIGNENTIAHEDDTGLPPVGNLRASADFQICPTTHLGFWPGSFATCRSKLASELLHKLIENSLEVKVGFADEGKEQPSRLILLSDRGAILSYELDPERDFIPTKAVAVSSDEMSRTSRSEKAISWREHVGVDHSCWFPEEITYKHWVDGVLRVDEAVTTEIVQLYSPLQDEIFTWESLGLVPGTTVEFRGRDGQPEMKTWDGVDFGPWNPKLLQ
ncbi:hypothetical protein AB1L42_20665 [Thalassoglobus sp. JC818]|uniref:hypothetical protein n=1 Tax=Thalassoglobus sp. JC818 TaxID=3232136 RepID=UPI003457D6D6